MRNWKRLIEVLESVNSSVVDGQTKAICMICAKRLRQQRPMTKRLNEFINIIVSNKAISPHIKELLQEAWAYLEMEYINQLMMEKDIIYTVSPKGFISRNP